MEKNEISDWQKSDANDPGFQLMTDDEICDHVLSEVIPDQEEEPQSDGDSNTCPVSHSMAAHMFDRCFTWLEHQPEVNQYNMCTLRELRALEVRKRGESLRQITLVEFFKVNVLSICIVFHLHNIMYNYNMYMIHSSEHFTYTNKILSH